MTKPAISAHAIERFVERSRKLGMTSKNPEAVILKILARAQPEQMSHGYKIERLINNDYKEARYLVAQGWRFVLTKDGSRVLTIERVRSEQN